MNIIDRTELRTHERLIVEDITERLERIGLDAKYGQMEDYQAGGALPELLIDLKREGHIDDRLYSAGSRLVLDMTRCHGTSAGLTAQYGDQVQGGRSEKLPSRFAVELDAFRRMDRVLGGLKQHERETLRQCVVSKELQRGNLSDMGRRNSRYATPKTARAFAVGQIKALLESVAEMYHMPRLYPPS